MSATFSLEPPADPDAPQRDLDADQRRVVDHAGGPLLVLAGPGAGKTHTLVETVVDRIENRGYAPHEVLVLTFSRKAADELKHRIVHRLNRTVAETPAMTFHSFCYALVRDAQAKEQYAHPMRLLSAPEQDTLIQQILAGADPMTWPVGLRPALGTRGMASELQRTMMAARAQGMDALDLYDAGSATDREEWRAAGRFFDEYAGIAALHNTIDYSDLIFRAVQLLAETDFRDRIRGRYRLVVVDEYQDSDPLQEALLKAIAGDGKELIVVGDPYQSIYGFRGANVRGIIDFPDTFGHDGVPAPTVVLRHTSRYGAVIADAVRSIIDNRGVLGAVDVRRFQGLRALTPRQPKDGTAAAQTYASATAESEHIALMLRQAHLEDGVPWNQMAVLVRSGAAIGSLRRTLLASGVPVDVAGDELPLAAESSVRALLSALHVADNLHRRASIDPTAAVAVLTGPLGGLDGSSLRRLGRALRTLDSDRGPRSSKLLLAEAVADPALLAVTAKPGTREGIAAAAAGRLATLLRKAADQITAGASTEEVLWTLWSGTDWPKRLRREAIGAGDNSARAHHDLDAMCALFAQAARAEERQAHRAAGEFVAELEAQQIPADSLAQGGAADHAVHLMTAHRAKGLEWDFVVVAGVQDGVWPDLRHRGSLLRADQIAADEVVSPPSTKSMLAEERRLFYVACTRARSRLVVTAVASSNAEGDQPSRFVDEFEQHLARSGGDDAGSYERVPLARPGRTMSLRGVVAQLRHLGATTDNEAVRHRAANLLATLASTDSGAIRSAHPDRWWGLRAFTESDQPIRAPGEPIRLSGSTVSALTDCPLKWFLDHEAKGSTGTTSAQGFGSVVHALAAEVVDKDLRVGAGELSAFLDNVWDQLDFAAPWVSRREKSEAVAALTRFIRWHEEHGRTVLAAEHTFEVETEAGGEPVILSGSMDRLEQSDAGVHVIDLKTTKTLPKAKDIIAHPQLGFYQLAVDRGAAETIAPGAPAAGAELVQLRNGETKVPDYPRVQAQDGPAEDEPFFAVDQLARSARIIASENFHATPSEQACKFCEFRRVCPTKTEGGSVVDGGAR